MRRAFVGFAGATTYAYDPLTFGMNRLKTKRASDGTTLQNLACAQDPVGNITEIWVSGVRPGLDFIDRIIFLARTIKAHHAGSDEYQCAQRGSAQTDPLCREIQQRKSVMTPRIALTSLVALLVPLAACVAPTEDDAVDEESTDTPSSTEDTGEAQEALSTFTLAPNQAANFPTWGGWGTTTVDIYNQGTSWGCVEITVNGYSEYMCAYPDQPRRIQRQWWGWPGTAANNSSTTFSVATW